MAWRVQPTDVQAIIETTDSIEIAPFIDVANALVNQVVLKDTTNILSTDLTKQIEAYLAAHFYALRDPQYQQKKTGDALATFQGKTDMGLDLTWWGQMAKTLDVSGELSKISNGVTKVGFTWLGKPESEQIPLTQRN
jgi:hypothetical protein